MAHATDMPNRLRGSLSIFGHCIVFCVLILAVSSATGQHPSDSPINLANKELVQPFKLGQVQLLDSPFKAAMERNAKYLLALEPDRLLHNTRKYAGLKPKGELYGGWEASGVAGHTLGHYLTALSLHYAATGDARFRDRIAYIVKEMAECQRAYGDGYVGALPPLELQTLRDLKSGKVEVQGSFNFKGGAWVPWYTQHKVLAGLKDVWTLAGIEEAKEITIKLADWVETVTRNLTAAQRQQMLQVEFGGMSETLADIFALTGNRKYLETSRRFYHEAILRPLLEGRDELAGKHANTQIPKIIGEARRYEVSGDDDARKIAEYFWQRVVNHHSYVIGGNSEHEHFGPPDRLAQRLGQATAESCNTYNMLRLTRHVFSWQPEAQYFDYYERALYNQILASQDPHRGMFAYFISLKPGHFKTFSTPFNSFWCCVGSGIENHTKYNDSIYFHDEDSLYVNLFIPSRLTWEEKGLALVQQTSYPREDRVDFRFSIKQPTMLVFKVRSPQWTTALEFHLNGKPLRVSSTPNGYAEIRRTWNEGDVLQVRIPMAVRTEAMPDDPNKVAFVYGPLVLAGDLGRVSANQTVPYAPDQDDNFHHPSISVPYLVTDSRDLPAEVKRDSGDLVFRIASIARPHAVTLRPFNELFYEFYNVYWDVMTPAQYEELKEKLKAEVKRQVELAARTIDEYRPGQQQSEVDHEQKGEKTFSGDALYRKFRHAVNGGWFSFRVKATPDQPVELICTYWGGESTGNRTFDILIDGKRIATETLHQDKPGEFFEKTYAIPAELTLGKKTVEVRFQAHPGKIAGGLFGARILKGRS